MHELEFLPDWYRTVRRKRMWLIVQAWGTAGLLVVLVVWTGVARFGALKAERESGRIIAKLGTAQEQVNQLHKLEAKERDWNEQDEVLSKLGVSVESTRLIGSIADATPAAVALTSMTLQIEEKIETVQTVVAARAMKDKQQSLDRKLRVRLLGIAPGDTEVWDLVTKLTAISFFEDVAMTYSKDADQDGRLVREFEVTFALDINAPPTSSSKPTATAAR